MFITISRCATTSSYLQMIITIIAIIIINVIIKTTITMTRIISKTMIIV